MGVTYYKKTLKIGNIKKEFAHEIKDTYILKDKILVLLLIPQEDSKTINNIYAITYNGEIVWRSQDLRKLYPDQINLPYEHMSINSNEVQATDFYGRRYFIDLENGQIKRRDIVK